MGCVMIYHTHQEADIRNQLADGLDKLKAQNLKFENDFQTCQVELKREKESFDEALKSYEPAKKELKELEEKLKRCKSQLNSN